MRRFFDFSSSMSHFLGVYIYGPNRGKWWHSCAIMPLWKLGRAIHRRKLRLLYRFHPSYRFHMIDTGLKPGPHMGERLILHASFSILMNSMKIRFDTLDRLETETRDLEAAPIGNNSPELIDHEVAFRKEMIQLIRWWTITRPADLAHAKSLADLVYGDVYMVERIDEKTGAKSLEIFPTAPEHKGQKKELRALRKKIAHEETEMLHRLIDIKGGLD
ncbi:hypothetical protein [Rhizobium sp. MHM7A]|uniref:hypothetical protein n=1 Tax=Rhizobium sp. MHM7A TaxID=2583233 RepID=UPI0011062005|nr:hypothetical protein [Rhizobium sp. MHM7A]TLX15880.1 hypothetical protein FFR93_00770 [Rhizobium sp. MHM7A]